MWDASAAKSHAGRPQRRTQRRVFAAAERVFREFETSTRDRWGSMPQSTQALTSWAAAVARSCADQDPRVAQAARDTESVQADQRQLAARHTAERVALRSQLFGPGHRTSSPSALADDWRRKANQARHELAQIQAIPVEDAAAMLRARGETNTARAARIPPKRATPLGPSRRTLSHPRGQEIIALEVRAALMTLRTQGRWSSREVPELRLKVGGETAQAKAQRGGRLSQVSTGVTVHSARNDGV
jgi:hypothetical protein